VMLRVFKDYHFPTNDSNVYATEILMSSYPGCLSSLDDYYVQNSNVYVTETTIENFNMSLYKRLTATNSVFSWVRTMVANRLSNSAKSWTYWYSLYNSGTYNNQWVIVDHNLYVNGMDQLKPETVYVLEQMPGYIESKDMTDVINVQRFWGGYNVPYFKYVFDMMDYPWAIQQYGQEYSENCSRANIMKRDHSKVANVNDMKHFMQYNQWQTDPLSSGDPCNSIAARCDLITPFDAFGAYDAKVTNHEMIKQGRSCAISGPTHQDQPVFVWDARKQWNKEPHLGEPNRWDFDWMLV